MDGGGGRGEVGELGKHEEKVGCTTSTPRKAIVVLLSTSSNNPLPCFMRRWGVAMWVRLLAKSRPADRILEGLVGLERGILMWSIF